jgi:hypothetical protein
MILHSLYWVGLTAFAAQVATTTVCLTNYFLFKGDGVGK